MRVGAPRRKKPDEDAPRSLPAPEPIARGPEAAKPSAPEKGKPAPYRADGAKVVKGGTVPPAPPKIKGVFFGRPRCPYCGSVKLRVIVTRPNGPAPIRTYECGECCHFRAGEATRFNVPEKLTGT